MKTLVIALLLILLSTLSLTTTAVAGKLLNVAVTLTSSHRAAKTILHRGRVSREMPSSRTPEQGTKAVNLHLGKSVV